MNPELEKILSCSSLPSLPMVALRVIELTSDVDVSLKELARTIENDQGLTAKILKTVNSSFYGLRQGCANIDKALVMLGLGPVKSLALGFSLVDSIGTRDEHGFDFVSYWRRGLYTAIGGKLVAENAGTEIGDEVFLGGLLQDVGMVAMHKALGDRYVDVLKAAGPDHRALVEAELGVLDLQHPDVGAMLVKRWKLPDQLVMPVKYHERPSAAPAACVDHVRCVGMGNFIHDILTYDDSATPLRQLYDKGKAWYKLSGEALDEIVTQASEASREMASLFSLDIGPYSAADDILAEASNRSVAMMRDTANHPSAIGAREDSVLSGADHDALTGAVGPTGFETAIREGFRLAAETDDALSLIQVVIDNYESLEPEQGEGADIEAAMGVAGLLKHAFEGHGGVVCRVAPNAFAVVLPGVGRLTASSLAETFQSDISRLGNNWTAPASGEALRVSTSIGIAALENDTRGIFTEPAKLVLACAKAIRATQSSGGQGMRVFQPRAAA